MLLIRIRSVALPLEGLYQPVAVASGVPRLHSSARSGDPGLRETLMDGFEVDPFPPSLFV